MLLSLLLPAAATQLLLPSCCYPAAATQLLPPPPCPRASRTHFQKSAKTKGDFPTIVTTGRQRTIKNERAFIENKIKKRWDAEGSPTGK